MKERKVRIKSHFWVISGTIVILLFLAFFALSSLYYPAFSKRERTLFENENSFEKVEIRFFPADPRKK